MNRLKQIPVAPKIDESSYSWRIFNAFVTDSQLSLSEDELKNYAINELNMIESKMPKGLRNHLPKILVAFMNSWSGWHFKTQFEAGKFTKTHYYQRFHKYMLLKASSALKGQYLAAVKALVDTGTACKQGIIKKTIYFSPYAIRIYCPPSIVNTLVFANQGDDVIMKQHLGAKWLDLSNVQLVNWPQVQVTFSTPDLYFIRSQATDFVRYLNFFPHESSKQHDDIIENVECYGPQECYSIEYLETYIKVYLDSLKSNPQITPTKLYEIQTILIHFLEDVKYLNVNRSMATNTSVLFRLSAIPFIRNKKLVKTNDKEPEDDRVGYCEIITPKVRLIFFHFKPQPISKDNQYSVTFKYPEMIKNPAERTSIKIVPSISYKCTYCDVEFTETNSSECMLQHLKNLHKMEQNVRCTACKKQFEVTNLAGCRWRHKCVNHKSNK